MIRETFIECGYVDMNLEDLSNSLQDRLATENAMEEEIPLFREEDLLSDINEDENQNEKEIENMEEVGKNYGMTSLIQDNEIIQEMVFEKASERSCDEESFQDLGNLMQFEQTVIISDLDSECSNFEDSDFLKF